MYHVYVKMNRQYTLLASFKYSDEAERYIKEQSELYPAQTEFIMECSVK